MVVSNGMCIPDYIEDGLRCLDRRLKAEWDRRSRRWKILRWSDRSRKHEVVKVVRNEDGSFRPLDRRTLRELVDADVFRRAGGRDEKYLGEYVARELADQQEKEERQRQKASDEKMGEARDKFEFAVKRLVR